MALTGRTPRGEPNDTEHSTLSGELEAARTREERRRDTEDEKAGD